MNDQLKVENGALFRGTIAMGALDERCSGCERIATFDGISYCSAYMFPEKKWSAGHCNLATHVKIARNEQTVKVNPLKASKRAAKGK